MSIDSPGVKSGTQLSLDKSFHLCIDQTDNDQYIIMSSNTLPNPRYAKSPIMKLRMMGGSEQKRMKNHEEECETENDKM